MRLIGLTGAAGSGKDAVASYLESIYAARRLALADPIRSMLIAGFGLSPGELENRELKEREIPWLRASPRHLMQTLGTEWGRQCVSHDVWIRLCERRIDMERERNRYAVIVSDIRFTNEAQWLRSLGGSIWRIDRPALQPVRSHVSETCVIDADVVIRNDGSLADLFEHIDLEWRRA